MRLNKNGRPSFDNLPLCTLDSPVLELFYKDLNLLYKLKEPLLHEGFDRALITGSFTGGDTDTLTLHTRY